MSKVQEFYDDYSVRQLQVGLNQRHYSILKWLKDYGLRKNHKMLEIGCGIGTVTYLLANFLEEGSITALDISPKSIEIAKKHLSQFSNVRLLAADILKEEDNASLEEKYDVILLPDVLEHIPKEFHGNLFKNLKNKLSNNGFILIHIPNPYYLAWCHENRPEILQVIDQPLYTDELLQKIYPQGLYLYSLSTYSIWIKQHDYQVLVLKKTKENENFTKFEAPFRPFHVKVIDKLRYLWRIRKKSVFQ
jgi:trans-aconitate 2-methyltransferase